jgi:hypothetical protein
MLCPLIHIKYQMYTRNIYTHTHTLLGQYVTICSTKTVNVSVTCTMCTAQSDISATLPSHVIHMACVIQLLSLVAIERYVESKQIFVMNG